MKNFIITIIFFIITNPLTGQIKTKQLIGSWVKISANYYSGEPLPLTHALNQSYLRIEFKANGKAFKSVDPLDNGFLFNYSVLGKELTMGFIKYQIDFLSNDSLILTEKDFDRIDNNSIRYFLIPEEKYQNQIPLSNDIIIKFGRDTLYIENVKIRAIFDFQKSFSEFLRNNIPEYSAVESTDNFFMSTFIIDSMGRIDSIQINKGINSRFDKQFLKAVEKSSSFWKPASINGKKVSVLHTEVFKFISNPVFEKVYYNYQDGILEMKKSNYSVAIEHFNRSLEASPNDLDALYNRGLCFFKLEEPDKACLDWMKIKSLKSNKANNLLDKFCK